MLFFPSIVTFETTVIQDVICGFDTGGFGNRDFLKTDFTGYFLRFHDFFLVDHFIASLELVSDRYAALCPLAHYQRGGGGGGLPGGGGGGVKFTGGEETLGPLLVLVLTGGSLDIFPDTGTRWPFAYMH